MYIDIICIVWLSFELFNDRSSHGSLFSIEQANEKAECTLEYASFEDGSLWTVLRTLGKDGVSF